MYKYMYMVCMCKMWAILEGYIFSRDVLVFVKASMQKTSLDTDLSLNKCTSTIKGVYGPSQHLALTI